MKIRTVALVVSITCLPQLGLADESVTVKYAGNSLARQVCRAVVQDDVGKLRMLLRSYRQTVANGYSFSLLSGGIARDFSCDDMKLDQFSNHIGAQKVSSYFAGESEASKQQVAVAGK